MKIFNTIFVSILSISMLYSCSHEYKPTEIVKYDTIYIYNNVVDTVLVTDTIRMIQNIQTDTVYITDAELYIMSPPYMGEQQTKDIMEQCIWKGYVDYPKDAKRDCFPEIWTPSDLEYLPYLYLTYSDPLNVPDVFNNTLKNYFISMCSEAIDDKELFKYGKNVVQKLNEEIRTWPPIERVKKNGKKYTFNRLEIQYPDSFCVGSISTYHPLVPTEFIITPIDHIRVRAIVHNDREALAKLEDYYKKINDPKGIAIYYKVMLGYEGNGDLAEKFYRVLEPYFKETPQFRMAAREALLRAALCDHNARAQQLCDSLGFSLCDYRLTPIE